MDETQQMAVLKDTKNLYQYFDATAQVEYLYECVAETIEEIAFIQRSWTCRTNVHHCSCA